MNSTKKICLKDFIPNRILCSKDSNISYDLNMVDDGMCLTLYYFVDLHNQIGKVGKREHNVVIPKFIKRNQETFEVLGLLQAEMGKKHDGKITFCNHEYQLINKVIKWFNNQVLFPKEQWKWYIKVNINEPLDLDYKKEVENKVVNYWIEKSGLSLDRSYPKKVSYIKNTRNKKLKVCDYGTLIIEGRSNLFSQIIKNFVRKMTQNILSYEREEIKNFMRGIIAGESNVEIHLSDKRYRVFITAKEADERKLFQNCLERMGIDSIQNGDYKAIIVSKKQNNLELLKQKLMTLSPKKYNKFLRMMHLYGDFEGLQEWRQNLQKPHNKIPQSKINQILELHHQHPKWPAWKIANEVGVSAIKVARVRKEHNLGVQITKTPESERKEIAQFAKKHLHLSQSKIAEIFGVHESVVQRAIRKYRIARGNKARCKIPQEKIREIIKIYNQNPAVKFNSVVKEGGISDTALTRIRREYDLTHLGYKHIIGTNHPKMNTIIKKMRLRKLFK